MIRALTLLLVGTVALSSIQTIPARAAEICGRTMTSPGQLLDTLRNEAGIELIHQDDLYLAFAEEARGIVWTFTRPNHPAHPAVVCRQVVQQGEDIGVETRVLCGGRKTACDRMVADFQDLNERMKQDIQRNHSSQ